MNRMLENKRILIANRGEIALRVIRACKSLGHTAIAVYSEEDRHSMHVLMADESICIGPAPSGKSYRNIANIITAAEVANVDAIHPGYGFLSENYAFASAVIENGFIFIGPSPEHIRVMGNKIEAKEQMKQLGVPIIPGVDESLMSFEQVSEAAKVIGYPLMIKASAGGGGKGMRIANSEFELRNAYNEASGEAERLFSDKEVYVEKYINQPRHIEFQIMCDGKGKALHVGERECSIQRRNQKVWEEAPSIVLDAQSRAHYGKIVCDAMSKMKYLGAGTLEFLYDQGQLYFMEMNTRIQVEHTVSERISGVDLIKWQIKVAFGEELTLNQEDIRLNGHAIECRINMENPATFTPSPGLIEHHIMPGGPYVRVDTALYPGYRVSSHYDSLGSKLIVWGEDRETCIRNVQHALKEYIITGPDTLIPLFKRLAVHPDVMAGNLCIQWLDENLPQINKEPYQTS